MRTPNTVMNMCERHASDDRESLIPRCNECGEYVFDEGPSREGSWATFKTIEEVLRAIELEIPQRSR